LDALQNAIFIMSRRILQSLHHVRALSICCGLGNSSAHAYSTSILQGPAAHVLRGAQDTKVAATSGSCNKQLPSRPWTHLQHAGISSSSSQASASSPAAEESSHAGIVSFPLAQTGEGISECELMQWFVKVCPTAARLNSDLDSMYSQHACTYPPLLAKPPAHFSQHSCSICGTCAATSR
jgi:hypothetical protein